MFKKLQTQLLTTVVNSRTWHAIWIIHGECHMDSTWNSCDMGISQSHM